MDRSLAREGRHYFGKENADPIDNKNPAAAAGFLLKIQEELFAVRTIEIFLMAAVSSLIVCVTDPGFRERFSVSPIESTNACPKLRIPHGFVRNADERI